MKRENTLTVGRLDGDHLRVEILGRAHPGGLSVSDHNWLCADISVHAAEHPFRYRAFLRTKDFETFHRSLRDLLAHAAPRARLRPRDPWLVVEIEQAEDGWSAEVTARDNGSERVAEFCYGPSREELKSLAVEVEGLVHEYPVQP